VKRWETTLPDVNPIFWGEFILHYPYAYAVAWRSRCCNVGSMAEMLGWKRKHSWLAASDAQRYNNTPCSIVGNWRIVILVEECDNMLGKIAHACHVPYAENKRKNE